MRRHPALFLAAAGLVSLVSPHVCAQSLPSWDDKSLAAWWAERRDIPCLRVPAEWSKLGRKAGPIRNALMLRLGQPNLVLAFPGGMGTRNMTDQAIAAGIAVEWAPEDELPE